jgi:hypothetical protein
MSRSWEFDTLFDQLETAIISLHSLKLNPTSDHLLTAVREATRFHVAGAVPYAPETERK